MSNYLSEKDWDKIKQDKNSQIAYFNSVNAAIARCPNGTKEEIKAWRDWFYMEWSQWYFSKSKKEPTSVAYKSQKTEHLVDVLKQEKLRETSY